MNKSKQSYENVLTNENGGVVIVTAILILVVLSILGISATDTTITEKYIAINDQRSKIAFFHADGAVFGTAKLISYAVNESAKVVAGSTDAPGITYLSSATDPAQELYDQILEYTVHDPALDIDFRAGGVDANSEVELINKENVEGGGVEFASGAEGIGYNFVALNYGISTNGFANQRDTDRALAAQYRKLVGIPGGM
jgi:hypothetical protein